MHQSTLPTSFHAVTRVSKNIVNALNVVSFAHLCVNCKQDGRTGHIVCNTSPELV